MNNGDIKPDLIVTISGGKFSKSEKFEIGRYWEIVGELIWRGADRIKAYDTAKWCMHAARGSETIIRGLGNLPDILLKVR